MNIGKYFKIVLGLLISIVGIYGCLFFWPSLWILIKGAVGPFVILIGLLVIAIAALD